MTQRSSFAASLSAKASGELCQSPGASDDGLIGLLASYVAGKPQQDIVLVMSYTSRCVAEHDSKSYSLTSNLVLQGLS